MLYIRHGEKSYTNGKSSTFSFDPNLTSSGKLAAYDRFFHLLTTYGPPTKIISSPYLRTRETAAIAQEVIYNTTGQIIPIYHDVILGEYLAHHRPSNLSIDLREETLRHQPIGHESWREYTQRIEQHQGEDNVWYITHGIVISSIASCYGVKLPRPSQLHGIYVKDNAVHIV